MIYIFASHYHAGVVGNIPVGSIYATFTIGRIASNQLSTNLLQFRVQGNISKLVIEDHTIPFF